MLEFYERVLVFSKTWCRESIIRLAAEGFQSWFGLLTVLRRRKRFQHAFQGFASERIARFGTRDILRLPTDPGFVGRRRNGEAVFQSAHAYLARRKHPGSLASFAWDIAPENRAPTRSRWDFVSRQPESTERSKERKRRGWKFVGPTTAHAIFQPMELMKNQQRGRFRYAEVNRLCAGVCL